MGQALGGIFRPSYPRPLPPADVSPSVLHGRRDDVQLPPAFLRLPLAVPVPLGRPCGPGVRDTASQVDGLPTEQGGRTQVGQRGFEFFYSEKC